MSADAWASDIIMDGDLLYPVDADYDDARRVFNTLFDRHPSAIARCASERDIVAALAYATRRGLPISVRAGGPSAAGFSVVDDAVVVDVRGLKDVTIDRNARQARAGAGLTWAELDAATQQFGLAVTGGRMSSTGVGGLTIGSGSGWLERAMGLTPDNVIAMRVVTADGRIVVASADENPDLFWALRGGGGNFGVVTSFEFRLHEVGPLVHLGLFFWGVEQGTAALRFSRDFLQTVPDDMGTFIAGLSAPPAPFVPEQYHFLPGYALVI